MDKDQAKTWSRRGFIGGLFAFSAGSILLKTQENASYIADFFSDLKDDVVASHDRINYSDFLTELEKDEVDAVLIAQEDVLITRRDGTKATFGINDSNHMLALIDNGTIDPNRIEISFDKNLPFLKDRIVPEDIVQTTVNHWDIPVAAATGYVGYYEAKPVFQDFMARHKASKMSPEEREKLAYHEAGHAYVRAQKPGLWDLGTSTIRSNREHLGVVNGIPWKPEREFTREMYKNEIICDMAGRAGEELYAGKDQYTTGINQDMKNAYDTATDMIHYYGMSDDLGPVVNPALSEKQGNSLSQRFRRRLGIEKAPHSEEMQVRIEREREKILNDGLKEAEDLLESNKPAIDAIAKALLEHETLSPEQVRSIISDIEHENTLDPDEPANV